MPIFQVQVTVPVNVDVIVTKTADGIDTDFGAFGVVARMNTNFHVLKDEFNKKRRRSGNKRVKETLAKIANDAIIAQTLL